MLKHAPALLLALAFAVATTACEKKAPPKLPPGTLTEVQKAELKKKAYENYKKLADKYPDSQYAEKAKDRMRTLQPPPKK